MNPGVIGGAVAAALSYENNNNSNNEVREFELTHFGEILMTVSIILFVVFVILLIVGVAIVWNRTMIIGVECVNSNPKDEIIFYGILFCLIGVLISVLLFAASLLFRKK